MNLLTISDAEYAVLRHVDSTGGWIPACDPVTLDEAAARHLVEANVLASDGESYTLTAAGKALLRWGEA